MCPGHAPENLDFLEISRNSCLQHGVLAMDLINLSGSARLASRRRPSLLSHVSSAVQNLDSTRFRMLLWLPKKSTLRSTSCLSLIARASKCCCSPCHTQNEKVRHLSIRPLLSSKSSNNDSNYMHSGSGSFLLCPSYFQNLHIS